VPLVILVDLAQIKWLGLQRTLFAPASAGGLNASPDPGYILGDYLEPDQVGPVALSITVIGLLMGMTGVGMRPGLILGCLAYAQLGHLYSPGDRAIDRLLRTVLVIWAFGQSHRLFGFKRPYEKNIPAWPADLARYLLVIVYLSAGISKLLQQPGWLARSGMPVLYRVMTDPMAAHMDPKALLAWEWPLRVMGWGTILLECSAWLIFTRFRRIWACFGVGMHLGIYLTMDLGIFSWGMLALYPLLLWPTCSSTRPE
jgi:hypothetical protein